MKSFRLVFITALCATVGAILFVLSSAYSELNKNGLTKTIFSESEVVSTKTWVESPWWNLELARVQEFTISNTTDWLDRSDTPFLGCPALNDGIDCTTWTDPKTPKGSGSLPRSVAPYFRDILQSKDVRCAHRAIVQPVFAIVCVDTAAKKGVIYTMTVSR